MYAARLTYKLCKLIFLVWVIIIYGMHKISMQILHRCVDGMVQNVGNSVNGAKQLITGIRFLQIVHFVLFATGIARCMIFSHNYQHPPTYHPKIVIINPRLPSSQVTLTQCKRHCKRQRSNNDKTTTKCTLQYGNRMYYGREKNPAQKQTIPLRQRCRIGNILTYSYAS